MVGIKGYLYGGLGIILILMLGYIQVLRLEVKAGKSEKEKLVAELNSVLNTNKENALIFNEKIKKSNSYIKSMEGRLKVNSKTCDEVTQILSLKGGTDEKISSDPILDMLNSLFPRM